MGISRLVRESDRKEQRKGEGFFRPVGIFPFAFSTCCLIFFLSL